MSDQARHVSHERTTSPSPGSSRPADETTSRVPWAGQLWDSENVELRECSHFEQRRPSGIPAERIPEPAPELRVTPDVRISLDRIQESLDNVSVSLQAILRSFERFTGGLVRLTGETETLRELVRGAESRSNAEHTPDEGASGTPDREHPTTEPGGA